MHEKHKLDAYRTCRHLQLRPRQKVVTPPRKKKNWSGNETGKGQPRASLASFPGRFLIVYWRGDREQPGNEAKLALVTCPQTGS